MNGKLYILVALSVLPWLYLGAGLLFDFASQVKGFGYLPFFALLLAKEKMIQPQKERPEWTLKLKPHVKSMFTLAMAILLTIAVIAIGGWIRDVKNMQGGEWLWALFGLVILFFISWDIRRVYRSIQQVA